MILKYYTLDGRRININILKSELQDAYKALNTKYDELVAAINDATIEAVMLDPCSDGLDCINELRDKAYLPEINNDVCSVTIEVRQFQIGNLDNKIAKIILEDGTEITEFTSEVGWV